VSFRRLKQDDGRAIYRHLQLQRWLRLNTGGVTHIWMW